MKVGAQPIILKENLQNLNDTLKDCKGYTKNNADLKESIVAVSDGNKQKQGGYGYTKTPCTETIQFYHEILSSSSEDGRQEWKMERQTMSNGLLVWNLASQIVSIAYANFIPCETKWTEPKGLLSNC